MFSSNGCPMSSSGISAGGQYALIAVGYTMVYGILRLINFAHGDIFMVAGLIMVYLSASHAAVRLPFPPSCILTVALGFAIERCAYKPLRQAPANVRHDLRHRRELSAAKPRVPTSPAACPKQYPELPWISDTITIARRVHQAA